MEKKIVFATDDVLGLRIDVFLKLQEVDCSRNQVKELILEGQALVNEKPVKPHYKLKEGDRISWQVAVPKPFELTPEKIALKILFEDDALIVLDKPAGLVVHPGAGHQVHTLVHALLFHTACLSNLSLERPGIVHRLDKDTSGVMVIAKTNEAHLKLAKQFKKHTIKRRYVAFVEGHVEFDEGVIDVPLKRHTRDRKKITVSFAKDAKRAVTFYRVLRRLPLFTALELYPETGRTHQLRVHLKHLGHAICGDIVYGKKDLFPRLALHAQLLGFYHPQTGQFLAFESPLPEEMKLLLEKI